ncbi:acyl-CoA dehydrogenase family protein [Rhodococcus opacus]|nr:acyl-CoA dehydrogenase family protein [Rhodococcus opacus]
MAYPTFEGRSMIQRPDLEDFRTQAREFFAREVPPVLHGVDAPVDRARAVRGALHRAGFSGVSIPESAGGRGLSADHEDIVTDEATTLAVTADRPAFLGVNVILPALIDVGAAELVAEVGPRILSADAIACQLFSEPDAGSDLAGVMTRATEVDGGWRVQGQKVWTSYAHLADFGLALVRTDPEAPKHSGLTMLLIDMNAPGVTVRPIKQMTGDGEFNEVFLDNVFVRADRLVGTVGGGWKVAGTVLGHERLAISRSGGVGVRNPISVRALVDLVTRHDTISVPDVQSSLLDAWMGERTAAILSRRTTVQARSGLPLGPETSLGKMHRTRNAFRNARLATEFGLPCGGAWIGDEYAGTAYEILNSPGMAFGGGTDDIQRNIVAERILGLPREQAVDPRDRRTAVGHQSSSQSTGKAGEQ